jgi:transposase
VIVAEVGDDMRRFATAAHLASWAGLCPGQRESAGKRKSGKTRKGSRWLRTTLIECAHAAARTKGSYLSERYRQLTRRRGAKKAAVAVAHELLVAVWRLLSTGEFYDDPGAEALRAGHAEHSRRRALRQLEALGYRVTLEPAKAA